MLSFEVRHNFCIQSSLNNQLFSIVLRIFQTTCYSPTFTMTKAAKSAKWDNNKRQVLLDLYILQASDGKGGDNGLKTAGWTTVVNEFNSQLKLNYKKSQLQSQWSDIKKRYSIFKRVKENSGFGWDAATQQVTVPDAVWETYFKLHPAACEFWKKVFLFF